MLLLQWISQVWCVELLPKRTFFALWIQDVCFHKLPHAWKIWTKLYLHDCTRINLKLIFISCVVRIKFSARCGIYWSENIMLCIGQNNRDSHLERVKANKDRGSGNRLLKIVKVKQSWENERQERQIPTVGSRRWEDKQQREFFLGSSGREQKRKVQRNRGWDPAECLSREEREEEEQEEIYYSFFMLHLFSGQEEGRSRRCAVWVPVRGNEPTCLYRIIWIFMFVSSRQNRFLVSGFWSVTCYCVTAVLMEHVSLSSLRAASKQLKLFPAFNLHENIHLLNPANIGLRPESVYYN